MMKWLAVFPFFFFLTASGLLAQDMPPLPPMPDQGQAPATSTNLPPLPGGNQPATAPASQNPSLPPLPDQSQAAPASTPATNPPATNNSQTQGTPPLPGEAAPATTTQSPAPEQAAETPTPETETAAPAETQQAPQHKASKNPFLVSKYRPNVIFGGWVTAKGGNEDSRLAWTSQEVLNALLFKKYKLTSPAEGKPEEGNYEGQDGKQWRQFNFRVPKSKLTVQVYLRQEANKKVWLRVGPGEAVAPAATSLSLSKKMRQANLAVLHLLQRKFGRRLAPRVVKASWEAPYDYSKETADR